MNLTISDKQASVLIRALDCYSRIGMGQLECIGDAIEETRHESELNRWLIKEQFLDVMKRELFGHAPNSSDGICSPRTGDNAKIAYDLQCVVRQCIAKRDDHPISSVWHGPPLHTCRTEPLAVVQP